VGARLDLIPPLGSAAKISFNSGMFAVLMAARMFFVLNMFQDLSPDGIRQFKNLETAKLLPAADK